VVTDSATLALRSKAPATQATLGFSAPTATPDDATPDDTDKTAAMVSNAEAAQAAAAVTQAAAKAAAALKIKATDTTAATTAKQKLKNKQSGPKTPVKKAKATLAKATPVQNNKLIKKLAGTPSMQPKAKLPLQKKAAAIVTVTKASKTTEANIIPTTKASKTIANTTEKATPVTRSSKMAQLPLRDEPKGSGAGTSTKLVEDTTTLSAQLEDTNITPPAISPIQPKVLHTEDTEMPTPKREYRLMHWYLMWDEMPDTILELQESLVSARIQKWFPAVLDYLFERGFVFQFISGDHNPGLKLKRKSETFAVMCASPTCSWEMFQAFFDVQLYFTSAPFRVHIQCYTHQRNTGHTDGQYIAMLPKLRYHCGVVVGRDPGTESFPSPKYPSGFTHQCPPAARDQYFLSCCGVKLQRTNLLRFSLMAKAANLPSLVVNKTGPKPEQLLQRHIGAALDLLQDITESDLAVIQYKSTHKIPPLTLKNGTFSAQFGKMSLGTFRRYANRGQVPRPGKDFWADVFLAFNGDSTHFNRDSYEDLDREFGVAMFPKGIQTSEHVERPYWLLYSHPDIDYTFLEAELLLRTGAEIELKFKEISDGTPPPPRDAIVVPGAAAASRAHITRGLLLSCGAEHLQHLSLLLPGLFNRDRSNESFMTHLRLVTSHGTALTDREREFQISARQRQNAYVRHARTFVINTIVFLDKEILGITGPITLRKFILGLTRPSDPTEKEPLFVEVGPKLRAPGKVVLVVRPDAYSEAEAIIPGLLPMSVHFHGEQLLEAFHPTARIAMAENTWDPIRRIVVSPTDKIYDTMNHDDDWMAFENLDDVDLPPEDTATNTRIADAIPALPPTAGEAAAGRAMMGDDDANTLGSLRAAQKGTAPAAKKGKPKKIRKESTQENLDIFKTALRGLFEENNLEFDSDEESIHTSLSIREQMAGLKALFHDVQRHKKTVTDMASRQQKSINEQSSGEHPSGEHSSSNSTNTKGNTNHEEHAGGSVATVPK
jgi:hypothetical protein